MPNLSSPEIIILAVVIMYFFGAKKLKEFARNLGESTREIKKFQEEIEKKDDTDGSV